MQLEKAGMIQVALYDENGQLVKKVQQTGLLGSNTMVMSNLTALLPGVCYQPINFINFNQSTRQLVNWLTPLQHLQIFHHCFSFFLSQSITEGMAVVAIAGHFGIVSELVNCFWFIGIFPA